MDRDEEELMSFGFFATIKESLKIIFSWKKIFSQIALSLILPLTLIFLTQIQIYRYLYHKLYRDEWDRNYSWWNSNYTIAEHFDNFIETDRVVLNLVRTTFFELTQIFSLLSTAAVVYTIGSVYTSKPVAYKKIIAVVPRVWKRLIVTFAYSFLIVSLFYNWSGTVFYGWAVFLGFSPVGIFVFIVLLVLFLSASIYMSVVWHVACVVSVLEENCGYKALVKAKELVKGKLGISLAIFFIITCFYVGVLIVYQMFRAYWFVGVACVIFLMVVVLFELVVQTVIYLVCKSYHHESIKRPALADHLDAYCGNDDHFFFRRIENNDLKKGIPMDQVQV